MANENDDDTEYNIVLSFDNQSEDFGLGFQAGEIWGLMDTREEFEYMFCGDNIEIVQRMACRKDYKFKITKSSDDDWYILEATPAVTT